MDSTSATRVRDSSTQSSRDEKLARRRESERVAQAAETAEEKKARLSKRRACDRARHAQLSSQQRQKEATADERTTATTT